jgi:hypothetical protein
VGGVVVAAVGAARVVAADAAELPTRCMNGTCFMFGNRNTPKILLISGVCPAFADDWHFLIREFTSPNLWCINLFAKRKR